MSPWYWGENWMFFKVRSNPKRSVILWIVELVVLLLGAGDSKSSRVHLA